jgi:hypothetical protein
VVREPAGSLLLLPLSCFEQASCLRFVLFFIVRELSAENSRLMHPTQAEDGSLTPAQRSMGGSPFRVVAAGAMLALVVGFGFAWGSSSGGTRRASSLSMDAYYDRLFAQDAAKAQGRQQKLWQGALSASLARKIVMKDTERGATAKARAPAAAATARSVVAWEKAAPAKPALAHAAPVHAAPVHAAPVRAAPVRAAPVQAAVTKHAHVEAAGKAPPALAMVATAAPATAAKVALANAAEKAPVIAAKAAPATAARAALATVAPATGELFDAFAAAASEKKMIELNAKLPAGRELTVSDSEKLALKPAAVHGAKLRALKHLSAKAAGGSAHAAAGGAPKAKAKAKPPKKGSQEWERQSDANFFDSLDKNESSEERAARKIKDRVQRRAKVHELYEREEEERVHRMNVKAREEQRNAELAAQKYTRSAFKDMDKHLTHINQDSVTGFKAMEAKELASEVERDHPNESAGQIAARAMKLLGMVLKGQQSTPHVGAVQNIVSPLGPMGVAPQVGM